ncbi:MAG: calcium-binding protein [Coxiellaceae bacterium]|nr:calcium-binding protein [Coxiellaceae bacterium]
MSNDLYFESTNNLTADTVIDGGDGIDTLSLSGRGYATFTENISNIEVITVGGEFIIEFAPAYNLAFDATYTGATTVIAENEFIINNQGELIQNDSMLYLDASRSQANFYVAGFNSFEDDQIITGSGNDRLFGYAGNDRLVGGAGSDYISGGLGDDTIYGEEGNDTLYGNQGNDLILGGEGDDVIYGGEGVDLMTGGAGDDKIDAGRGDDNVFAGEGDDSLFGSYGDDTLRGGAGDDVFYDDLGKNIFDGGAGDDLFYGTDNLNKMLGGAGDDTFSYEFNNLSIHDIGRVYWDTGFSFYDQIDGGEGMDQLVIKGDSFVTGNVNFTGSNLSGVESIVLSTNGSFNLTFDSTYIGSTEILTDAYNESLFSFSNPFSNLNVYAGDSHADFVVHGHDNLSAVDRITTGYGDDTLYGNAGVDILKGGAGDDTIFGGEGADYIFGGSGDDTLIYEDDGNQYDGGIQSETLGLGDVLLVEGKGSEISSDLFGESVSGIEILDIRGSGNNTLNLSAFDAAERLENLTDTDNFIVKGNEGDAVLLDAEQFMGDGQVDIGGETYVHYVGHTGVDGTVDLYINNSVTITVV